MTEYVSMPEWTGFDWSSGNAEKNWISHGISPSESEQVFFNRPLVVADDIAHSGHEKRLYVLGQTDERRELFIVFTMRGKHIRVISARDMNRKERRIYRS
jgi:uncharacterized DUF497 family protein